MRRDSTGPARGWGANGRLLVPCEYCGSHFLVKVSEANRRFCSDAHYRAAIAQTAAASLSHRFWSKVARGAGCWAWQASRDRHGYGRFGLDGHVEYAHRVAWVLTRGAIPQGLRVLHRCDNPPCCNPAHLYLGTPAQNTADMISRGREGFLKNNRFLTRPEDNRGERNPAAKLTAAQVHDIRRR